MSEQVTSLIPMALVPSGVKDDRQQALARLFGEALAKIDLSALSMSDPMTVDARLLPFMIREFGAQDFIDPDFPEHVQRRILAHIWELKSLHGYDAGVRLGLSLLGMRMVLKHWHQESPRGTPNTHAITFLVGETLFDEDTVLGARIIVAAHHMIAITKRQSQESVIRIGVNMRNNMRVGAGSASLEVSRPRASAKRPTDFKRLAAVAPAAAAAEVIRSKGQAKRLSGFAGQIRARAGATVLQINRLSAYAA